MRKIRAGRYMYRGYELVRFPYHRPDHSVIWEAVCPDNGLMCVAHDYTLKALKKRLFLINGKITFPFSPKI